MYDYVKKPFLQNQGTQISVRLSEEVPAEPGDQNTSVGIPEEVVPAEPKDPNICMIT